MCKVIVVGNDKSSLKSCLGGPLKAAGFDVLAWVSWADIDQTAPPKETELVVFNKCGIEPKENDCGVRCLGWKLDMRTVYATKKAHNINKLLEWKGARSERKKHVPSPVEAPEVQPMTTAIVPTTPLQLVVLDGDTEPRALDTDIAKRAELAQPLNVRTVIKNNWAELSEHGEIKVFTPPVKTQGGRPSVAYYLNEDQSYALLALLKTEPARRFRVELLKLFKAYRNGELASKAPQVVSARDQLRLLLQSQDELEARVNGKVGELSNKLKGLDSFAGNLESEQERIEREAKERAEQERKDRVEAIAILRAKQEELEDALTRPRGPVQTTIVNTRVIGDKGAVEIFDAIKAMAVSAARERMREDWDSLDWVALYLWCDSFIYAHSRDSAGVYGTSASLTFSQAEAWRGALTEDLRRETIAWTRDRRIPSSYHKRAKVYRHKPIQQKSNVIKLVKPEEPEEPEAS